MKIIKPTLMNEVTKFSRASNGGWFDSTGAEQVAPVDTPRLSYNPNDLTEYPTYLLEQEATNLALNSGAPSTQDITVVSGNTYTVSFKKGSGTVTLTGATTGSVTVTSSVTFDATTTNLHIVPSGDVQYFQVELGAKATSFISTTTVPVTRAADIAGFYTDVVESTAEYAAGTTYAVGSQVYVPDDFKIYESLRNSNTGNTPSSNLEGEEPYWYVYSASNDFKPFDGKVGSVASTDEASVRYVLPQGIVDGIAIFNMENMLDLTFTLSSPNYGTKCVREVPLSTNDGATIIDWSSYFFTEFEQLNSFVSLEIPAWATSTLIIDFKISPTHTGSIGEIVFGRVHDIGATQYAPEVSFVDYSRKTTDAFGNFSVSERAFSRRLSTSLVVQNRDLNKLSRMLAEIRATPVVWVASDVEDYTELLVIYGYFKDLRTIIPHPIWAEMSLQIEGLI